MRAREDRLLGILVGLAPALVLAGCREPAGNGGPGADPGSDSATSCASGSVWDGEACVPEACGAGPWGEVDGDAIYVDDDAAEGGDGSPEAPLRTLQEGADAAAGGVRRVAVAGGRYSEQVVLGNAHADLVVEGRCAALVTVDGSGGDDVPTVWVSGERGRDPEISLEGLTLTGGVGGLRADAAVVHAVAVAIEGNVGFGLVATDRAVVTLEDGRATGTAWFRDTGAGVGVIAGSGASVTLTRSAVDGNANLGVAARDAGTTVTLDGSSVSGNVVEGTPIGGILLDVGASLHAAASHIDDNGGVGVYASDADTTVELVDTTVDGTIGVDDDRQGWGAVLAGGAAGTLDGCTLEGNTGRGLSVSTGATAALEDTWIVDTHPDVDGGPAEALAVEAAGAATIRAGGIRGARGLALLVTGVGSRVEMDGAEVRDGVPPEEGADAPGVLVYDGGAAVLDRSTVSGVVGFGVVAYLGGASLTVRSSEVSDTLTGASGSGGLGVGEGATVTVEDSVLAGNAVLGVSVLGAGASLTCTRCTVDGTVPGEDGRGGRGIEVHDGGTALLVDSAFDGNTDLGVYVGADGMAALDGTSIVDTVGREGGASSALYVGGGGVATMQGGTVARNGVGGLFVNDPGSRLTAWDVTASDQDRNVLAENGGAIVGERLDVSESVDVGVFVAAGSARLVDGTISATRRGPTYAVANGIVAQDDGVVEAIGTSIVDTEGPGIYVVEAAARCEACTLRRAQFAGALLNGGSLTIVDSVVEDTLPDAEFGGGIGVMVAALGDLDLSTLVLTGTTIGPHPYAAVWLDGDGAYTLVGDTLSGSEGVTLGGVRLHGNALFAERGVSAWNGETGLDLRDTTFRDAPDVAVLLDGAAAAFTGNTWTDTGVPVWQQRCEDIVPIEAEGPDWVVCPDANLLTDYTLRFETLSLPEVEPSG